MQRLIFATNNGHKIEEVSAMLDGKFDLVSLKDCGITEDIPETQPTLEGNALQKARYVYSRTGTDCFADDTGLEVEALNGAPGVHSARFATSGHDFDANNRLLLEKLKGRTDRKARFRTVIALILSGKEYTFEGIANGSIAEAKHGNEGFGYDPLFIPDGESRSFAELSPAEKNAISHRGLAVRKLVEFLKNNG